MEPSVETEHANSSHAEHPADTAAMNSMVLKATIAIDATAVRVVYELKNPHPAPIYVFDIAYGSGAAPRSDFATIAYAEPDTLVLASQLDTPPPGMSWASPPEVYATRVEPGATLRRERVQPLPLKVTTDTFALPPPPVLGASLPPATAVTPTRCSAIRIVLGFTRDFEELSAKPAPSSGEGVWVLRPTALKHQQLLYTEIRKVDVSLSK
jgi:hypothetical protein